MRLDKNIYLFF